VKLGSSNASGIRTGYNPLLPTACVTSLLSQLTAQGWTGYNDTANKPACATASGPCP
jgi:hypothetical protein